MNHPMHRDARFHISLLPQYGVSGVSISPNGALPKKAGQSRNRADNGQVTVDKGSIHDDAVAVIRFAGSHCCRHDFNKMLASHEHHKSFFGRKCNAVRIFFIFVAKTSLSWCSLFVA